MVERVMPDEAASAVCAQITTIHTLGPVGTNCQRAAELWLARRGRPEQIVLHPTLELGVEALDGQPGTALLGCIVYPELHTLVFTNLHRLVLVDCFIVPTHNMILAARPEVETITSVATHLAPSSLVPASIPQRRVVNSNTQAALDCAAGLTDACITTLTGVEQHGLKIIHDFGPVPMGFTIHAQRQLR